MSSGACGILPGAAIFSHCLCALPASGAAPRCLFRLRFLGGFYRACKQHTLTTSTHITRRRCTNHISQTTCTPLSTGASTPKPPCLRLYPNTDSTPDGHPTKSPHTTTKQYARSGPLSPYALRCASKEQQRARPTEHSRCHARKACHGDDIPDLLAKLFRLLLLRQSCPHTGARAESAVRECKPQQRTDRAEHAEQQSQGACTAKALTQLVHGELGPWGAGAALSICTCTRGVR